MPFFEQASDIAGKVDSVFLFTVFLSAVFLVFITGAMIYFVVKYSRKRHPKGEDIHEHRGLEISWTVIPLILFMVMFYFGWTSFNYMRNVPRDAMVITATARQWSWSFAYPNGKQTTDLILALGKPARIDLRSVDVLHGFYIPAFRVKEDVVPGKNNYTWFTPTRIGSFDIECTVICGVGHAKMLAKAVVIPVDEFTNWYFSDETALPVSVAATIPSSQPKAPQDPAVALADKKSCLTCHSLDGTVMVGPTFKGLYGRDAVVALNGKEKAIPRDRAYLKEAILNPGTQIVKGYPAAMPVIPMTDDELKLMMDLIKRLQ
jgi:cytochrome c oxidase subunit II